MRSSPKTSIIFTYRCDIRHRNALWEGAGTSCGHQRGLLMAKSGDLSWPLGLATAGSLSEPIRPARPASCAVDGGSLVPILWPSVVDPRLLCWRRRQGCARCARRRERRRTARWPSCP